MTRTAKYVKHFDVRDMYIVNMPKGLQQKGADWILNANPLQAICQCLTVPFLYLKTPQQAALSTML